MPDDELTREQIDHLKPSAGEDSTSVFLRRVSWLFVIGGVAAFIDGKYWPAGTSVLIAVVLHSAAVYWPKIKLKIGRRLAAYLDRITSDSRYWWGAVLLLLLYPAFTGVFYVRNLRRDLDTYVMPRVVTSKQVDDLKELLSHHKAHSVTVKVNPRDAEAREYWGQLSNALRRTEWNVEVDTSDAEPRTINDGLCIHEVGGNAKPNDPKNDPRAILEQALREAKIISNCGGGSAAGDYKLFILVGHRPLAIGREAPNMLQRLGRWLTRFGE